MYSVVAYRCARASFAGALLCLASAISALEVTPLAGVSLSHTDNARLNATEEIDDWIIGAYAGLEVIHDTQDIETTGFATISHERYQDETFDESTYANLEGSVAWTLIEDWVVLEIQDVFSQKPVRSIDSETPDNNQDVNAFSIGPLFTFPVSNRHQLIFHPVFRDYYFETSRVDNERFLLYTKWRYLMQPGRELAFHADIGKVDYSFDEAGDSPDFDTKKLYLGFTSELRRAKYTLHLGVTDIDRKVFFDHDGFYGSFNWDGELSDASRLSLRLVTDLTDNGTGLLDVVDRLEEGAVIGTGTNVGFSEQLAADIMRNSQVKVAYRRRSAYLNTSIVLNAHQLDYKEQLLDRDVYQLSTVFDYKMSPTMTARLHGNYRKSKLKDPAREDELYSLGLGLNYTMARRYTLGFEIYHQEKTSTAESKEYSENRGILRLNFR